ncbi:hypothetical protein [Nocardia transvalensis]|uniref:hypothetical protein n=1 Tax=Nocardia transvalensis TaxID=37333 RepID=UPI0018952B74|nr:hypothetical protein [Nocardia transvalensis]MBF6328436.1 hypothetical protein [Nocardia transvalensis]
MKIMVDVLTRTDYEHQQYLGSAGPTAALAPELLARWRGEYPDWAGKYWAFRPGDTGTGQPQHFWLRPVNVSARAKETK